MTGAKPNHGSRGGTIRLNNMAHKLNIAVLMGGASEEHEVSLRSGAVVAAALDKEKYNVTTVVIPKSGAWSLPDRVDVVFNALHGGSGEDGTIQGVLENYGVPYTGSGVLASALAMDKVKSSELFRLHGLRVPTFVSFSKQKWQGSGDAVINDLLNTVRIPCVIKPSNAGSSVGVTLVHAQDQLRDAITRAFHHADRVIAQEYIPGTEVTCGVFDEGGGQEPRALPVTECVPKRRKFFDYTAKYDPTAAHEITPARILDDKARRVQAAALEAHTILGCEGMSRSDFILAGEDLYILETNTIPGLTEGSLLPKAIAVAGIPFTEFLDKLIQVALNRR